MLNQTQSWELLRPDLWSLGADCTHMEAFYKGRVEFPVLASRLISSFTFRQLLSAPFSQSANARPWELSASAPPSSPPCYFCIASWRLLVLWSQRRRSNQESSCRVYSSARRRHGGRCSTQWQRRRTRLLPPRCPRTWRSRRRAGPIRYRISWSRSWFVSDSEGIISSTL